MEVKRMMWWQLPFQLQHIMRRQVSTASIQKTNYAFLLVIQRTAKNRESAFIPFLFSIYQASISQQHHINHNRSDDPASIRCAVVHCNCTCVSPAKAQKMMLLCQTVPKPTKASSFVLYFCFFLPPSPLRKSKTKLTIAFVCAERREGRKSGVAR